MPCCCRLRLCLSHLNNIVRQLYSHIPCSVMPLPMRCTDWAIRYPVLSRFRVVWEYGCISSMREDAHMVCRRYSSYAPSKRWGNSFWNCSWVGYSSLLVYDTLSTQEITDISEKRDAYLKSPRSIHTHFLGCRDPEDRQKLPPKRLYTNRHGVVTRLSNATREHSCAIPRKRYTNAK